MEVKKGYKQTELGAIPNDWEIKEFVDVMDGFTSGQTPYRAVASFYKGDIPWITSGELNYNIITDTIEKITPEGVKDANLKIIPRGTFLFAITGLEAAGTRGSCAITGVEATTNQSCMALYPKKGLLTTPYLYHYYVRYGNELAFKYCQGTKQQSYTGGVAKKLPIILPPTIEEQTAIATALSDTDALITSLEKLIAKRRNIKQGAMQELLKPKKGWEVKRLGDLFEITSSKRVFQNEWTNKGVPFYRARELAVLGQKGYVENELFITRQMYDAYKKVYGVPKAGDILVTGVGTLGKTFVVPNDDEFYFKDGNIIWFKINGSVNSQFLNQLFKTVIITKQIEDLSAGTTVGTYTISGAKKTIIPYPPFGEQEYIAKILSDMDSEIEVLERKLEKITLTKSGMMQNLLTGKIRLV